MQITKLIFSLVPLTALASPIEQHGADLVDRAATRNDGWVEVAPFTETRDNPKELFRRNIDCTIVSSSIPVNCRSCPSTKCGIVAKLNVGSEESFKCAVQGECVKVNGKTNCSWDKADRRFSKDCWVNGHYTDYRWPGRT
ncbi:hypothetical protein DHEL01_v204067 [Diaporthe helianthi]|uniref:Uncharacterized protein n=1 Tax=Diaporthe helianthi TaxID=158607 RepID=A0A2P5I4U2_DIAHE|nr:hypothetical protein DHEL01_v204067 [Diaporthe helianthi]